MSATIPDTMPLEEITKATGYDCPEDLQGVTFKEATSGAEGGMSASEINAMVTRLIADKQDKKIVFENQEMLLTEALQRVNAVANGKAQIFEASELPAKPAPNSQYWVATYNGQTSDNGRFIILVDSLGVAHLVGKSVDSPSVNDVQINGTSIVDGATKTANIRLKTTIDDTVTDTDVISGKAISDFYKNVNIEDVTKKIKYTSDFNVSLFRAFKIGEHLLYVKFRITDTSGTTMLPGSKTAINLDVQELGLKNMEQYSPGFCYSTVPTNAIFNGNSKVGYLYVHAQANYFNATIAYLIPINV